MALDARNVFIVGIGALLFTLYYLEKHYEKEEIFWMYSLLSVVFGILAAYTVIIDHPSRIYYIPLVSIFIVMSILYYRSEEEAPASETG
ncbi:MAG: hypothetical protein ACE5HH_03490 [Candidatus Hydrothermarchaeales archaeon]